MPRAGKPLPGSTCATAMTKLLPCQVKVPQPLIDCGNRSIWNGEKNRVTGRNQRFRRGEAPCASPRRRLLGRFSVPAMIAGHRNAALDKPFAQGEANFSRSKKSYLHPITLPFPVRVTRWVVRARAADLQGTCRYSFLFGIPSVSSPPFPVDQRGYCIIRLSKSKGGQAPLYPGRCDKIFQPFPLCFCLFP